MAASSDHLAGPRQQHTLKLKGKLGAGAFGDICKGMFNGSIVAVKTVRDSMVSSSWHTLNPHAGNQPTSDFGLQTLFREAHILRNAKHRNIIGFQALMRLPPKNSESTLPVWALVMECAEGGDLRQIIAKQMTQPGRSVYSTAQALSWALDIASALEYLHMCSPSVLHRDVKCANVLLATEKGTKVAKLADFGLHVAVDNKDSCVQSTSTEGVDSCMHRPDRAAATSTATQGVLPCCDDEGAGEQSDAVSGAVQHLALEASALQLGQGSWHSPPGGVPAEMPDIVVADRSASQNTLCAVTVATRSAVPASNANTLSDVRPLYSEERDQTCKTMCTDCHDGQMINTCAAVSVHLQSCGVAGEQQRTPPAPTNFRRAAHHPPGEALPRVASFSADCGMGIVGCSVDDEGTWTTSSTEKSARSVHDEVETVFDLTGRTGSCLYMAPEVYKAHSYNEKSDVFSFGVVLYELLVRTLIVFTELPTSGACDDVEVWYAAKVAAGYRPSRPKSKHITDDMWSLITACWQQDPLLRPHMSEVCTVLQGLCQPQHKPASKTSGSLRETVDAIKTSPSTQRQTATAAVAHQAVSKCSVTTSVISIDCNISDELSPGKAAPAATHACCVIT